MDVLLRCFDGQRPKSPEAAADYMGTHLQSPAEAGALSHLAGYLSKDKEVRPMFDPSIWQQVGWDSGELPPRKLIINLTQGFDLHGNRLAGRGLFRAPIEFLITLPAELSEALKHAPEAAAAVLKAALDAHLKAVEELAIRKRSGKGRLAKPDWAPAKVLALNYPHGENRGGESHLHLHSTIFPSAWDPQTKRWYAYDNAAYLRRLSHPGGGRDRVTKAIIAEAAKWGFLVELESGMAQGEGPQGARVVCPDGSVIAKGTIKHERRAEIIAAQELRRACGANPLTPKELELVRRETGKTPLEIKGTRRLDLLERKLADLGFLDGAGRIGAQEQVTQALSRMEEGMGLAQVSLSDLPSLPGSQDASALIKERRRHLMDRDAEVIPDTNKARIRWTAAYEEVLELVAAHPEGLRTDGLDQSTRNLLSKLKRAGIITGRKVSGRSVYALAPAGTERLQKGRRDQKEVELLVKQIIPAAIKGSEAPSQVRGRLESLGIIVDPDDHRVELGVLGRTVKAPDLVATTGIQPDTPSCPDVPWWVRWWSMRSALPDLLQRLISPPEKLIARWGEVVRLALTNRLLSSGAHTVNKASQGWAGSREREVSPSEKDPVVQQSVGHATGMNPHPNAAGGLYVPTPISNDVPSRSR